MLLCAEDKLILIIDIAWLAASDSNTKVLISFLSFTLKTHFCSPKKTNLWNNLQEFNLPSKVESKKSILPEISLKHQTELELTVLNHLVDGDVLGLDHAEDEDDTHEGDEVRYAGTIWCQGPPLHLGHQSQDPLWRDVVTVDTGKGSHSDRVFIVILDARNSLKNLFIQKVSLSLQENRHLILQGWIVRFDSLISLRAW